MSRKTSGLLKLQLYKSPEVSLGISPLWRTWKQWS